jgi:hypothetical protein
LLLLLFFFLIFGSARTIHLILSLQIFPVH